MAISRNLGTVFAVVVSSSTPIISPPSLSLSCLPFLCRMDGGEAHRALLTAVCNAVLAALHGKCGVCACSSRWEQSDHYSARVRKESQEWGMRVLQSLYLCVITTWKQNDKKSLDIRVCHLLNYT